MLIANLDESIVNCLTWDLFRQGKLGKFLVVSGKPSALSHCQQFHESHSDLCCLFILKTLEQASIALVKDSVQLSDHLKEKTKSLTCKAYVYFSDQPFEDGNFNI